MKNVKPTIVMQIIFCVIMWPPITLRKMCQVFTLKTINDCIPRLSPFSLCKQWFLPIVKHNELAYEKQNVIL
jgi:hypothetical protein